MNNIRKIPLAQLGYDFIEPGFLPDGQDEYYLRNLQNRNGIVYRRLTAFEIEVLVRNGNTSDNWNNLLVSDAFNPELVKNCKFYGLVRIGKLEPYFLEFSQLKVAVGLYNSTIVSCDFGDNVVIDNINYLSHYIIGSEAIIINVNELITTPHAKFGNGVIKEGEPEEVRIWMELCNENGGRKVIPFNGMLPADAWLWSKYRSNPVLLEKFRDFTQKKFDSRRGYYGKIGDRTVIKNCSILKDVWIGSDAYLKGGNKLKNLTINSDAAAPTQIGEGCELVNGIVGYGCRIFYGVKAVRFILSNHSQLKYGARLINSFLGHNSTISCCEVLNSLIFPAQEQHHNNSFLCAALVMGQSNIAAGATIGSNHNSRSADGEIQAGRGFWPGLCVSLKYNCRFAAFTMIAKGDYHHELNVPLPFCLLSQPAGTDELQVMPAYWFMHNMYALARNAWKYENRDQRIDKTQQLEFDYLAPDSVNEMFEGMRLLETLTGKAWYRLQQKSVSDAAAQKKGLALLRSGEPLAADLEVLAPEFEKSRRKVRILKPDQAWKWYRKMILFYGLRTLVSEVSRAGSLEKAKKTWAKSPGRKDWLNAGGQLVPAAQVKQLLKAVEKGHIHSWEGMHATYRIWGEAYEAQKAEHAMASWEEITEESLADLTEAGFKNAVRQFLELKTEICQAIEQSRKKDHLNTFRKMMYDSTEEMELVLGRLEDNEFIKMEKKKLAAARKKLQPWL